MASEQDLGQQAKEGIILSLTAMLAGTPLSGAKLKLYKSSFSPNRDSVAADFAAAEADFTGYAASTLTWSAVGVGSDDAPVALSTRAFYQATDAVAPNVIGGCWLENDVTGPPAVNTVLEWFPFANPVALNTALAFVGVVIGAQLPGGSGFALVDY